MPAPIKLAQLGKHRDLALLVAASRFPIEYAAAVANRDDDFDPIDTTGDASVAALCIEPIRIYNYEVRNQVIDAFGPDSFVIDPDLCYLSKDRGGVSIREYTNYGTIAAHKFIPDSELLGLCFDNGSAPDDDKYVTIRIKTGKGGTGVYKVPKSVAGDMIGCD